MEVSLTKKGYPALWEEGGGWTSTGFATIIADPHGDPKAPIYIKESGSLACGRHALFIVNVGDIIIMANHHRGDFKIEIYTIEEIDIERKDADIKLQTEWSEGEWSDEKFYLQYCVNAVRAAREKARDYHCRGPYYLRAE